MVTLNEFLGWRKDTAINAPLTLMRSVISQNTGSFYADGQAWNYHRVLAQTVYGWTVRARNTAGPCHLWINTAWAGVGQAVIRRTMPQPMTS